MNTKLKRTFSTILAMSFYISTSQFINPLKVNADVVENSNGGKFLTGINIEATEKSNYYESGKYDEDLYNEIMSNYDESYTDESNPLLISDAADLAALSKVVNEGGKNFNNRFVKLTDDIDLQGTKPTIVESDDGVDEYGNPQFKVTVSGELDNIWIPIGGGSITSQGGSYYGSFNGSFDGDGHEIKNMVVLLYSGSKYQCGYAGLFGYSSAENTFKNVGLTGDSFVLAGRLADNRFGDSAGGLVGNIGDWNSTISNCWSDCTLYVNTYCNGDIGVLCGRCDGVVKDCHAGGDVFYYGSSSPNVGGLIGERNCEDTTNCYTTGNVYATGGWHVGAICGEGYDGSGNFATGNVYAKNCTSSVGGLYGVRYGSAPEKRSFFSGNVYSVDKSNCYVGGLAGDNWCGFEDCYFSGNVYVYTDENYGYVGGLCGNSGSCSRCYTAGNVFVNFLKYSGESDNTFCIGGLVGKLSSSSKISNCYTPGNTYVKSDNENVCYGGIVGTNSGGTVENCYSIKSAKLMSDSGNIFYGGIAGQNDGGTVENCYSLSSADLMSDSGNISYGGVVGENVGTVQNCFYNSESKITSESTSGTVTKSDEGTMLTSLEMTGIGSGRSNTTMVGFLDENWSFGADNIISDDGQVVMMDIYYPTLNSLESTYTESNPKPHVRYAMDYLSKHIDVNIEGEMFAGEQLNANVTYKTGEVIDNLKYQWYINDREIAGETNSSFSLRDDDVENKISVKISHDHYCGNVVSDEFERDKSAFNQQDEATKVWVLADYGVFPYKSRLSVTNMNDGENYNIVMSILDSEHKNIMERIKFYDIKILDRDNNFVQPNGKVTVRLPIPSYFDIDDLNALRVTDDKDIEFENERVVTIDNVNYLEFETEHFSYYALLDELTKNETQEIIENDDNSDEIKNIFVETSDKLPIILVFLSVTMLISCLVIVRQKKSLRS